MTTNVWLPEARRIYIQEKLFEYYGCSNLFDQGGLYQKDMERREMQTRAPELVLFLKSVGISHEEFTRFYLWFLETLSSVNKRHAAASRRFTFDEAIHIATRVLGIPKDATQDVTDAMIGKSTFLTDFVRCIESEASLAAAASRTGFSDDDIMDAAELLCQKLLELAREAAPHRRLTPSEEVVDAEFAKRAVASG